MKLKTEILIVVVMLLLSACVAPPPQAPAAQIQAKEVAVEPEHDPEGEAGLPEQMGEANLPISCMPEAQAEFNNGLALLHSFWFGPAIESFNQVADLDPACAMAHWGVAMSLLGIPWSPTPEDAVAAGMEAVEKAIAAGAPTPREQAYIDAVATLYRDAGTRDFRARTLDYEAAMAQIVQDNPDDTEAQTFYALSLLMTAPSGDKSYANQSKAAEILEPIFVAQPNHPGAAHYLVHSYDYPSRAANGLDAAQRFAAIAPAASHALHMPAHIFTRMGYWRESIITNQAGAAAAKASLAATYRPATGFVDALHAMDYMMYAYLQEAQDEAAKALLDEIAAYQQIDKENLGSAYALAAMPARYVLERRAWDEAAMIALHPAEFAWERFPQAEATQVLVQGLGAAHVGNVEAARQSLERLQALHDALVETNQGYWADQATIQIEEVAAWLALAEGKPEEALASMRHAVELESATEKHPVTPGPIVPAYELLGDMLLDLGQSVDALAAFETSLQDDPNRFRSLYGAANAAELAGEMEKAKGHYTALVALDESADSDRAELVAARTFLGE